jgi:hypothetical protein
MRPGTDLRGEPDALRLAAGERRGAALERQVVEADVDEEAEPLDDLLDHAAGDLLLALGELDSLEELERRLALITVTSWMLTPPKVTARISGLSRAPPHVLQGMTAMYSSSFSLTASDSLSFESDA